MEIKEVIDYLESLKKEFPDLEYHKGPKSKMYCCTGQYDYAIEINIKMTKWFMFKLVVPPNNDSKVEPYISETKKVTKYGGYTNCYNTLDNVAGFNDDYRIKGISVQEAILKVIRILSFTQKPQKFLSHPKLDITPWGFKEPLPEIGDKVFRHIYHFISDKGFTVQPHIIRVSELQVVTLLKEGKVNYDNTSLSDPGNVNEPWYKCYCDVWMRGYQGEGLFVDGGYMIYNGEVFYPCQVHVLKNKNNLTIWCEQLNTEDKKILDNAIAKLTEGKEGA